MKDLLDGKITNKLTFRHILLLISGLAIASSTFLPWLTYNNLGKTENLTGLLLHQTYAEFAEISVLSLIGAALFLGTLIASQLSEFTSASRYPKYVAALLTILAIIITIEATLRLQPFTKNQIGISFFNNAGYGWYLALGGAITSLVAIIIPHKKKRNNKPKA